MLLGYLPVVRFRRYITVITFAVNNTSSMTRCSLSLTGQKNFFIIAFISPPQTPKDTNKMRCIVASLIALRIKFFVNQLVVIYGYSLRFLTGGFG